MVGFTNRRQILSRRLSEGITIGSLHLERKYLSLSEFLPGVGGKGAVCSIDSLKEVIFLPCSKFRCSIKPRPNDRNMPIATLLGATCCVRLATVLRHVGCCWLKFDQFQTLANNTQHVATHSNMAAKRTQRVVLACCDRLAGA